jgi:glutaredoxin/glutathione-dependent peroxiredoxin
MTIKVGDRIPSATLIRMTESGPQPVSTGDIFNGKKIALFAVPGAFTSTCSAKHLPSFLNNADAMRAKGVAEIICIAVNDPFVLRAWGEQHHAGGKVTMLSDGNGDFTRALGLEADMAKFGMGKRSRRYSMLVDNGVVKILNLEEPGGFGLSSGDHLLKQL